MSIDLSKVTALSDQYGAIAQLELGGRVIWSAINEVGTIILRPSADISVQHKLHPNTSTAGYLLINEEVADGVSTHIASHPVAGRIYTSKFKLSSSEQTITKKFVVTSVNIMGQVYSADDSGRNDFCLEINGESTSTVTTTGGKDDVFDLPVLDAIGMINNAIATSGMLPDINISITSYTFDEDPDKVGLEESGVTQVYVVLGYEA